MLAARKLVADNVAFIKAQCAALIAAKVDDGRAQAKPRPCEPGFGRWRPS